MKEKKLYIVNNIDRPSADLLAEEIDEKLYYIHPRLRFNEQYRGMDMERSTPAEDFGLTIKWDGRMVFGELTHESCAKYPNGKPRYWQGSTEFRFFVSLIPEEKSNGKGGRSIPRHWKNMPENHSGSVVTLPFDYGVGPVEIMDWVKANQMIDLLQEIIGDHSDDDSTNYNHCDEDPCQWCRDAENAIYLMKPKAGRE